MQDRNGVPSRRGTPGTLNDWKYIPSTINKCTWYSATPTVGNEYHVLINTHGGEWVSRTHQHLLWAMSTAYSLTPMVSNVFPVIFRLSPHGYLRIYLYSTSGYLRYLLRSLVMPQPFAGALQMHSFLLWMTTKNILKFIIQTKNTRHSVYFLFWSYLNISGRIHLCLLHVFCIVSVPLFNSPPSPPPPTAVDALPTFDGSLSIGATPSHYFFSNDSSNAVFIRAHCQVYIQRCGSPYTLYALYIGSFLSIKVVIYSPRGRSSDPPSIFP